MQRKKRQTDPADSNVLLSFREYPIFIKPCKKPLSTMNGRNARATKLNFQPKRNATIMATLKLAKLVRSVPIRIPEI